MLISRFHFVSSLEQCSQWKVDIGLVNFFIMNDNAVFFVHDVNECEDKKKFELFSTCWQVVN